MAMEPGKNMVEAEDGISRHALKVLADEGLRPYIAEFKTVKVQRGSDELFTKTSLTGEEWKVYKVLKSTCCLENQPALRNACRGVLKERAQAIWVNLVPHVRPHKREFWRGLLSGSRVTGEKRRTRKSAGNDRKKSRKS